MTIITAAPTSIDEGFFNDLTRQPPPPRHPSDETTTTTTTASNVVNNAEVPKTKRIACVICRKRKLRCDGARPKCSTCSRLDHQCAYDEVRRKSGPKRGYVKELEARLAQVETQLKDQNKHDGAGEETRPATLHEESSMEDVMTGLMSGASNSNSLFQQQRQNSTDFGFADDLPIPDSKPAAPNFMAPEAIGGNSDFAPSMNFVLDDNFSWEMIGLGLEEPLPMQEAIDELTQIYFDQFHPSQPFLHKGRFYTSMSLSPQARPPVCLRYAMWALSASMSETYKHHKDIFYRRARKYLEVDEMKGAGEAYATVAHVQTWVLLAGYEFKHMYFPRAWLSTGRATRIGMMIGLNQLDAGTVDAKQCMPPPKDWTEREERRRTFWSSYCSDRYASIGTGWAMTIDERDIATALPASDESYESSIEEKMPMLRDRMTQQELSQLSPFAGLIYVTKFLGANIHHLHRHRGTEDEHNLQGTFWQRHRQMDDALSTTCMILPPHLRLPVHARSPNVVFLNFSLHTACICLHQAAIFKAEKHHLPMPLIEQSRSRCLMAAIEIANIMRMTSHLDISGMNPFMAFALHVAARVFVQYLRSAPADSEILGSLEFLLSAMAAVRRKNPLAESFMMQLSLDIESAGIGSLLNSSEYKALVKNLKTPWCDKDDLRRIVSEKLGKSASGMMPSGVIDTANVTPDPASEEFAYPRFHPSTVSHSGTSTESPSMASESPRQSSSILHGSESSRRGAPLSGGASDQGAIHSPEGYRAHSSSMAAPALVNGRGLQDGRLYGSVNDVSSKEANQTTNVRPSDTMNTTPAYTSTRSLDNNSRTNSSSFSQSVSRVNTASSSSLTPFSSTDSYPSRSGTATSSVSPPLTKHQTSDTSQQINSNGYPPTNQSLTQEIYTPSSAQSTFSIPHNSAHQAVNQPWTQQPQQSINTDQSFWTTLTTTQTQASPEASAPNPLDSTEWDKLVQGMTWDMAGIDHTNTNNVINDANINGIPDGKGTGDLRHAGGGVTLT